MIIGGATQDVLGLGAVRLTLIAFNPNLKP